MKHVKRLEYVNYRNFLTCNLSPHFHASSYEHPAVVVSQISHHNLPPHRPGSRVVREVSGENSDYRWLRTASNI